MSLFHPCQTRSGNRLVAVNADGRLIGLDRFGLVAHPLMHQPQPCPGIGIAVVEVEGGIEIFECQLQSVDLRQALAARQIGGGNKRVAVDGGIEIIDGGLPLALPLVD